MDERNRTIKAIKVGRAKAQAALRDCVEAEAQAAVDKERFSDKDRETAQELKRAYVEREGGPPVDKIEQLDKPGGFNELLTEQNIRDMLASNKLLPKLPFSDDVDSASREEAELTVGRVVPAPGHPSPHARRDTTEEWDMRPRKKGIAADPVTGRGDARGPGYDAPLNPMAPLPSGSYMEDQVIAAMENEIDERLGQGADGGGQRLNAGKNRIELLPPEWLWALADVMTQGSKKYDPRNWEKGMNWSSMIGCMHRHIAKFQAGQRYDGPKFDRVKGTTGCHELAMVAWNALALMVYDLRGIGNNDIPHEDYAQLDLFRRVNAETSDLSERIKEKDHEV